MNFIDNQNTFNDNQNTNVYSKSFVEMTFTSFILKKINLFFFLRKKVPSFPFSLLYMQKFKFALLTRTIPFYL